MILDNYPEPLEFFRHYFALARQKEPHDATAVALATAQADGRPSVRMVLLKGVDAHGFVFFSNYQSRKAGQLQENPYAAMCFYWPTLDIQVRAEGAVEKVSTAESDEYFNSRPRGSQLAAWSSQQSAVLAERAELLRRYAEVEQRFAGQEVARPPFWGGYRLVPDRVEFWQSEPYRMHDRLLYLREGQGGWRRERLFP